MIIGESKTSLIKVRGRSTLAVTIVGNGHPARVLITHSKNGTDDGTSAAAQNELINLAIDAGVSLEQIATRLIGITSGEPWHYEGVKYLSVPDAIGQLIAEFIECGNNFPSQPP